MNARDIEICSQEMLVLFPCPTRTSDQDVYIIYILVVGPSEFTLKLLYIKTYFNFIKHLKSYFILKNNKYNMFLF